MLSSFDSLVNEISNKKESHLLVVDPRASGFKDHVLRTEILENPFFAKQKVVLVRQDAEDDLFYLEDRLDVDGMLARNYNPFQMSFVINRLLFPQNQNKRLHARALVEFELEYRAVGKQREKKRQSTDLSVAGAFIQNSAPEAPGTQIELTLHIPGSFRPVSCLGMVMHARATNDEHKNQISPSGYGVRFDEILKSDRSHLNDYLQYRLLRSDRRATDRSIRI